ncbi:Crp/Fnr family transcriptional regulator [Parvibaculum sp.]|jgi:CRP-like cAMP-binding protein|uniref:Crp/Fnr family transcriptional regulator n=1 Tax=Parvibaculum sp. TaxID=2024848 RepID=UPI001B15FF8B|nr:Crp/Fnr family transcriptional regulator [Parvibaculum sp.]MBO6635231.1 Crp/Fnr family transcriptional regulator [Parvibaculum sp.]MBO6678476.1 Crp/Fnr family transcriptional regulator [Parvibaculum sp.]MBO6685742.1 Crp/Fnr family transcriptional regulator [Parvibaculum sp.]
MANWTKPKALELLSKGWLGERPEELRQAIIHHGHIVTVPAGASVYRQGDLDHAGMYALLEGDLRAFYYYRDIEKMTLWTMGPGAWFGQAVLFDDGPRPVEFSAFSECRLFLLPISGYRRIVAREPRYMHDFALLLCYSIRTNFNATIARRLSARERAASAFVRLAHVHGRQEADGLLLDIRLSQSDIASLVGVSRQYMNELLAEWQRDGLIENGSRGIRICDLDGLKMLADS